MGYHLKSIEKGELGEFSKIREEFEEFSDAVEQQIKLLEFCELADLIGAIEAYAIKRGLTLVDLISMMEKTKNAFQDGSRR